MRKWLLACFMLFPSVAAADVTVSSYWYHPTSTMRISPDRYGRVGEFAVAYVGVGRIAPIGEITTMLYRAKHGPVVGGVYYHAGLQWRLGDSALLEIKHGSWHSVDVSGRTEMYNRVGIQIRLP